MVKLNKQCQAEWDNARDSIAHMKGVLGELDATLTDESKKGWPVPGDVVKAFAMYSYRLVASLTRLGVLIQVPGAVTRE